MFMPQDRDSRSPEDEDNMSEEEARQIAGKFKGAGDPPSKSLRELMEKEKDLEGKRDERLSRVRE